MFLLFQQNFNSLEAKLRHANEFSEYLNAIFYNLFPILTGKKNDPHPEKSDVDIANH